MLLTIAARSCKTKREAKRLRINKKIPAVVYNRGKESSPIVVDTLEFNDRLRALPKGHLSTSIFSLKDEQGNEQKVLIKEVQYNKTTYEVEHLDFIQVGKGSRVTVNVPVVLANTVDCIGVKMGGQIQQLVRQIKVKCAGDKIPTAFVIDVKEMNVDEMKRIKDIPVDKEIQPLIRDTDVIVNISKK